MGRESTTQRKSQVPLWCLLPNIGMKYPKMALSSSSSSASTTQNRDAEEDEGIPPSIFLNYFSLFLSHTLHLHDKSLSGSNWDFGGTCLDSSDVDSSSHTLTSQCQVRGHRLETPTSTPWQYTWAVVEECHCVQKPQGKPSQANRRAMGVVSAIAQVMRQNQ